MKFISRYLARAAFATAGFRAENPRGLVGFSGEMIHQMPNENGAKESTGAFRR